MAATCSTIQAGIDVAQAGGHSDVYVAANKNPYEESISLSSALTRPIAIHGGWQDVGGTWTRDCSGSAPTVTQIHAPSGSNVTVTVQTGVQATLDTLSIYSADNPGYGESVYGVMAAAGASVTLLNAIVVVAGAGPGAPGGAGASDLGAVSCNSTGTAGPGNVGNAGDAGTVGTYEPAPTGYVPATAAQGGAGTPGGNGGAGSPGGSGVQCDTCQVQCCEPTDGCNPPKCSCGTSPGATSGPSGAGSPGCGGNGWGGGGGGGGRRSGHRHLRLGSEPDSLRYRALRRSGWKWRRWGIGRNREPGRRGWPGRVGLLRDQVVRVGG
jgi:hypothetical protein